MERGQADFQGSVGQVCLRTAEGNEEPKQEQAALWEADRASWARDQPVTAWLASHLSLVPICNPLLPNATTDGRHLFFNVAWSAGLDDTMRRFVHAHLVWHAVAGDYRPVPHQADRRWHLACDHAVNAQLLLLGFPLYSGAVLFPACMARSVSEVCAWLANHPCPEAECSPDRLAGQVGLSPSPQEMERFDRAWRQRIHNVVRDYLGTPWLPDPVAAWLLTRR